MTTGPVEIVEVPAPASLESEEGRLLRACIDVRNAAIRGVWNGDASFDIAYDEALATWQNETDEETVRTLALVDGAAVGRGYLARSRHEAQHIGQIDIAVAPAAAGRGIGKAIAGDLLARASAMGIRTVQAWITHRPAAGPQIAPPTGFGSIAAEAPEVRFARTLGFELEQLERMSELRLEDALPRLSAFLDAAAAHAGDRYRVETWAGRTPSALLEPLAALHARMSTDAPSADLDTEAEQWDAGRVERYETAELDGGRTLLRSIAIEASTGALVAFTTLSGAPGRRVFQHDTLVHADHRGHRLGMLVKAANLLALAEVQPDAVVTTWNAEENRPMLSVNEALGFAAVAFEGAWQMQLEAASMRA